MKKKQTKQDKLNKTKDLIALLKKHGARVYEDLENGEFPKFSIPNRSISNIIYDKLFVIFLMYMITSSKCEENRYDSCKCIIFCNSDFR